jgi:ribosomal protein L37AE/L43A
MIKVTIRFGDDLSMNLKELKKLADTLDDSGKQELIFFLQSRTKGVSAPVRAIDEIQEQKHKDGLVCPHCKTHSVVRFGKYAVKTRAGEVKRQRYRCKSCR